MFTRQTEVLGTACRHERQGLQGFECGTRKTQPVRITKLRGHLALGIDHSHRAQMLAFERCATEELDQGNMFHSHILRQLTSWRHQRCGGTAK